MKKQFPFLLIMSLCMVFTVETHGQTSSAIPKNMELSFNGVFVNNLKAELNTATSENGLFTASYTIGAVSDENRQIHDFSLFKAGKLLYNLKEIGGSELMISNSGLVAVFDMRLHFRQQINIHFINPQGDLIRSESYRYASLFDFSPKGNSFVTGTDKKTSILNLANGKSHDLAPASKIAFSDDEVFFTTAREGQLLLYRDYKLQAEFSTGLFYPRAVALDRENDLLLVVGKKKLIAYDLSNQALRFEAFAQQNCSFRDIIADNGLVFAGLHNRSQGISKGILNCYTSDGELVTTELKSSKKFNTFPSSEKAVKSTTDYGAIPWPFEPFDQVHKVWNHYEQHMGDGSGDWSYLHQGLDLEVPINEPTYAVEEGWVKLVLTIGGEAYWRVAISPEQSSGYSDGWLYAHLVQSSIQVDVGDYVELHDYLGDIIYWSSDWGHIHFVNIHDQGDIWYYDDDEWGINFNPLLALTPITDDQSPVIEEFSTSSKFGFCENETSTYLDPDDLSGAVDIIAKISDYYGSSNWEQPGYVTYYWLEKFPEDTVVFPKTLGQILNHSYSMYNGGYYEDYAPLLYKKDWLHPSPPWMNHDRDYYQVLTNNNGDSIAEPWETELAFNTTDYYDGSYQLFVEAWDEYGNMAIDSQQVTFANGNIDGFNDRAALMNIQILPNPAINDLWIKGDNLDIGHIIIFNNQMRKVKEIKQEEGTCFSAMPHIRLDGLTPGIYYMLISSGQHTSLKKFIKM